MRVVVQIWNGIVEDITADIDCEVLVMDRDEYAETRLPDGERGYAVGWDVSSEPDAVEELFSFAGFPSKA